MSHRILLASCALLLLGVLLLAFAMPELTHAAPMSGTFTVNSTADNTTSDAVLTLREAMLLALGGTGASGLNRALSAGEKAQLSGCVINGSNLITSGCGVGITDTIYFNVPMNSVINLNSSLPIMNDSAGTTIEGIGVFPVINASAIGLNNAFYVGSSHNALRSLTVKNAPLTNINNIGSYNTFFDLTVTGAGLYGISLSGAYNTVDTTLIGMSGDSQFDCSTPASGNGSHGIYIPNSITAQNSTVRYTHIGCNGGSGIEVASSSTPGNHTFGPSNIIGGNATYNGLGNWGYGINLGSNSNLVHSSWLYGNNTGGIGISASSNNVYGTVMDSNQNGIILYGSATNNRIGCTADCLFSGAIIGNILIRNWDAGLIITGTSALNNYVFGNRIGIDGANQSAYNALQGVLIYGAGNNYIGAELNPIYLNWIDYHANASNIKLDGGAFSNSIVNNQIAYSAHHGIEIVGNSHDNIIGGATSAYSNTIFSNSQDGIYVTGYNNTINSNSIYANLNGVHFSGNAHDNVLSSTPTTGNLIIQQNNDGIVVDGTAHANIIGLNYVGTDAASRDLGNLGNGLTISGNAYNNLIGSPNIVQGISQFSYNRVNGIAIAGANVYGNVITSTNARFNSQNGLLLTSGAHDNSTSSGTNFGSNTLSGVRITLGAHDNTIGPGFAIYNLRYGIELTGSGTNNNLITGTVMYSNTFDAISEDPSATQNAWSRISAYHNHGLGIDKSSSSTAGNIRNTPYPSITSITSGSGMVNVNGSASPSIFGSQNVVVEVYRVEINPDGFPEGKTFLGSTSTQLGTGTWTVSYADSAPGCYVAFQTIANIGNGTSTSSEYGLSNCQPTPSNSYLPLILR